MGDSKVKDEIEHNLVPKEKTSIEEVTSLISLQLRIAKSFMEWKRPDLASEVKGEMKELLKLRNEIKMRMQSMESLAECYSFDLDTSTNFEQILSATMSQHEDRNFNPVECGEFKALEDVLSGSTQAESSSMPAVEYEDLEIVSDDLIAPNIQCPITGKRVYFCCLLDRSIVDRAGYIYEREAILDHISSSQDVAVQCPAAGTSHTVAAEDLKPAYALVEGLKRKRRRRQKKSIPDII